MEKRLMLTGKITLKEETERKKERKNKIKKKKKKLIINRLKLKNANYERNLLLSKENTPRKQ
jgi:hypothetical protein